MGLILGIELKELFVPFLSVQQPFGFFRGHGMGLGLLGLLFLLLLGICLILLLLWGRILLLLVL